jgi:spectinomycin phosphotransferase
VPAIHLTFLPIGADPNTAVYRLSTEMGSAYFLKLRRGGFDEMAVLWPHWLSQAGIRPIIAPLSTRTRTLWSAWDDYTLILYPFIDGQDGYQAPLTVIPPPASALLDPL